MHKTAHSQETTQNMELEEQYTMEMHTTAHSPETTQTTEEQYTWKMMKNHIM